MVFYPFYVVTPGLAARDHRMSEMPAYETVRVFISSTFRDMQAERDHLVRFVFPRLREELLSYRIHLAEVVRPWRRNSYEMFPTGRCA